MQKITKNPDYNYDEELKIFFNKLIFEKNQTIKVEKVICCYDLK